MVKTEARHFVRFEVQKLTDFLFFGLPIYKSENFRTVLFLIIGRVTLELETHVTSDKYLALARRKSDIPYSYRHLALSFQRYADLDASRCYLGSNKGRDRLRLDDF